MNINHIPDATKMVSIEECCLQLQAAGWKEWKNQLKKHARCFYKRFPTPTNCACNWDKEGMQIQLAVSNTMTCESVVMELTLCGELKDGTWVEFLNYGLPKTVKEVTALVPRMLAIWEAANHHEP